MGSTQQFHPAGIQPEEDEQQYGKGPEGRASVAEKGQRDPDHRHQPDGHPDVDGKVKKQDGNHAVAVDTAEVRSLPFGQLDQPYQQQEKKEDDHR